MYGCVHSGGDGPTLSELDLTGYDTADGVDVEEKTYSTDGVPAALASAIEGYMGTTMGDTGDTVTVGDYTFTCVAGPCSITVSPDESHFTVVGTINVAATSPVAGPTDAEVRAEGMRIAAAIGPGTADKRADAVADVDETDGDQPPFAVDGGEFTTTLPATADDMDDDFAELDGGTWTDDSTGSDVRWAWSYQGRDLRDEDGLGDQDSVLSYTDIADPTDVAYQTRFVTANADVLAGITSIEDMADGNVINFDNENISALAKAIDVAEFPTGDRQTFTFVDDLDDTTETDERTQEGSFYGVPGNFICTSTPTPCTVVTDMDGNIASATGTWTFTPDEVEDGADPHMAIGAVPDEDYMDFGIWSRTTTVEDEDGEEGDTEFSYAFLAYAQGKQPYGAVGAVEGFATYVGPALGAYVTKVFDATTGEGIPTGSGAFHASAELTANFGGTSVAEDDADTITGTIKDFTDNRDPIPGAEDWVLELDGTNHAHEDGPAAEGAFSGTTMGMNGELEGEAGMWNGAFNGDRADDALPSSMAGTFDGHFNNGHVYGAFGANMVEEDDE